MHVPDASCLLFFVQLYLLSSEIYPPQTCKIIKAFFDHVASLDSITNYIHISPLVNRDVTKISALFLGRYLGTYLLTLSNILKQVPKTNTK